MKTTSRTKFKEIFEAAVDLPAFERSNLLADVCVGDDNMRAEIEKLLAADDAAGDFLESSPFDESTDKFIGIRTQKFIGKTIGQYCIEREIGAGGMGTVFLATRTLGDIVQKVAIKIVHEGRHSEEIIRRFLIERKILAELEHSGIARLIDAGETAEGLPYLAMEYIAGVPLDEYCRTNDLAIDERLELFRKVCGAVAFAHRRLIIHRDLKPSNIIVTADGETKLLDFGIAKLLEPVGADTLKTATVMNLLTPAYAAPEQILGKTVTTATDVYSLGVILYELLTGIRPFSFGDKNYQEIVHVICEADPLAPSSSHLQLKGDLDNIVLKSLRKDPERRYQTVEQFSEDIERYQKGLPVSARPDTFSYRAAKFFDRNKLTVAVAGIFLISLIGGAITVFYQYTVANRERALAERRFSDVRALANNVVFRYNDEIAKFPGSTALRGELVEDAVKYLDGLSADEIEDVSLKLELARAYQKIGDVQGRPYTANLGKSEEALTNYQKSVDTLEKASAKSPDEIELKRELVRSYLRLFSLQLRLRLNDNPDNTTKALKLQLEVNDADPSDPIANAAQLADVYITQADYNFPDVIPERIAAYQKAADLLESIPNKTSEIQRSWTRVNQRIGSNYIWHGEALLQKGETESAFQNFRIALPYNERMSESVKTEIAVSGGTPNLRRNLAGSFGGLGDNYSKLGDKENSLTMLRKNLEISLELASDDAKNTEAQIDVANAYISFADAYEQFGELPKTIVSNEKALEIYKKLFANDEKNGEVANGLVLRMNKIADLLEKAKRAQEARNYRQKTIELCKIEINHSTCKSIAVIE